MTFINLIRLILILHISNLYLLVSPARKVIKVERIDVTQIEKYLVSILEGAKGSKHICTGTILTERWVLTSAKCFEPYNFQHEDRFVFNFYIFYPKYAINGTLTPVEEIIIHGNFKRDDGPSDIALMKTIYSLYTSYFDDDYEQRGTEVKEDTVKLFRKDVFPYGKGRLLNMTCLGAAWVQHPRGDNSSKKRMLDLEVWPVYLKEMSGCHLDEQSPILKTTCYPIKVDIDIDIKDRKKIAPRSLYGAALICDDVQVALASMEPSKCDAASLKWLRIDLLYHWIGVTLGEEDISKVVLYREESSFEYRGGDGDMKIDGAGIVAIIFVTLLGIFAIFCIIFFTCIYCRNRQKMRRLSRRSIRPPPPPPLPPPQHAPKPELIQRAGPPPRPPQPPNPPPPPPPPPPPLPPQRPSPAPKPEPKVTRCSANSSRHK